MVRFHLVVDEDPAKSSAVVFGSETRVVPGTDPNWQRIVAALTTPGTSFEEIINLIDGEAFLRSRLERLSDRVTIRGEQILVDGDPVEGPLTDHIIRMYTEGDDNFTGYVAFLENLSQNPSAKSRADLFRFLENHDFVITEDGYFIGYKGVQAHPENLSSTAGNEEVTVTVPDGDSQVFVGNIPNPVGAIVEMARSLVDDNSGQACSTGLHVGNYSYANGFSQRLLTVKVNPRDVVAVPHDSFSQKIRTCRYVVLEVNDFRERYQGTSLITSVPEETPYEGHYDEDEDDFVEDYDDEEDYTDPWLFM